MFSTFGNTNTQTQPAGSTSLFGATNTQQQPTGGLFGSTNQTQPAQGSIFGSQPQQQPATSGGLFGSGTQNTGTGGSLFENTANQNQNQGGAGLFGSSANAQQPQTGGLFGSTTTQTQPQAGGSLFGNATNQNSTGGSLFVNSTNQNQTGSGLFGNTTAQQPQNGGLFGSATNQTQPAAGGLFGSTANQPSTSAAPSGGLFGSTTTNTSNPLLGGGGGLFGNANKPAGSLFGQSTTNTTTPSLFGSTNQTQPANTSLFGQPSQQQTTQPGGSLFGSLGQSISNANTTGSLFGSTLSPPTSQSINTLLSSAARSTTGPVQQQADAQSQFTALMQRMEGITHAWNSNSPQCRFQHYFYNLVDPNHVNLYGRPPNATNDTLWQKAVKENPDRTCHVPVIAIGFDDLQERVKAQSQQATTQQEKLKELKTRIEALCQRHEISNVSRLQRASSLQTQLTHRLLKLIQHLHLLIPALRSSAIRPEEEALRTALEEIEEDIRAGRMRGKLNELWALVGAVNAARERKGENTEWAVVDEEGLNQIAQILKEQQTGLSHLTKIVQRNLKDLAVIQGDNTQDEGADHFFNSTSTLRASTLR